LNIRELGHLVFDSMIGAWEVSVRVLVYFMLVGLHGI
jgi:hypothetical protein